MSENEVLRSYTDAAGYEGYGFQTPHILAFGKQYYNCDSITALPVENDGDLASAGSHFERAIFINEVMTASEIKDAVFSGFSFSLLKDTGWYGVVPKYFEEF